MCRPFAPRRDVSHSSTCIPNKQVHGRWDMQPYWIITNYILSQNEEFPTMKCTMGRWSMFSCCFDVNRSTFHEDMRENDFFTFSLPAALVCDL